ncbi:MAG: hypothetical protein KJ893_06095 [Candidatus Omnitrophica bacterium]|nr:hypothetical protein [Candidatus Omnitrophota bacterium]MBU4478615.1 hypothetical protein [Candidatus Omnitrophota bacterium]
MAERFCFEERILRFPDSLRVGYPYVIMVVMALLFCGELLFLPMLAVSLFLLVFFNFIIAKIFLFLPKRRFCIDAENQVIIVNDKQSIPFNAIKSVTLLRMGRDILTKISLGRFRRIYLPKVHVNQEAELLRVLRNNIAVVKQKSTALAMAIFIVLLAGVFLWQVGLIYKKALHVFPRQYAQKKIDNSLCPDVRRHYVLNGFSFSLPESLSPKKDTDDAPFGRQLTFSSENEDIILIAGTPREEMLWQQINKIKGCALFLRIGGIKNSYGLSRVIYYNRIGILPLLFKMCLLAGNGSEELYAIDGVQAKGFLRKGRLRWSDNTEWQTAELFLFEPQKQSQMGFNLVGKDSRVLEAVLAMLILPE